MAGRRILALSFVCGALLVAGCGSSSSSGSSTGSSASSSSSGQQMGYEGMPLEQGPELAPASTTQTAPVDGISCGPIEQLAYHIHTHLAVYANGSPRTLPTGIGIPGSIAQQTSLGPVAAGGACIYWLHTHTADGVIHVESPTQRVYTLGNFFDVWHQPLSANAVAGAKGKVYAFLNGKPWMKSPRDIPLVPHGIIQLDVEAPVPPFQTVSWAATQL